MRTGKSIIIWLVAFVALSTVLNLFNGGARKAGYETLAFSDFMNEVDANYRRTQIYDLCSL